MVNLICFRLTRICKKTRHKNPPFIISASIRLPLEQAPLYIKKVTPGNIAYDQQVLFCNLLNPKTKRQLLLKNASSEAGLFQVTLTIIVPVHVTCLYWTLFCHVVFGRAASTCEARGFYVLHL